MEYVFENGKKVIIPEKLMEDFEEKIGAMIKNLKCTYDEAVNIFCTDNNLMVNEEQKQLHEKAKKVKINHGAVAEDRKERKAPERKPDVTKEGLIAALAEFLNGYGAAAIEVTNKGKLVEFKLGEENFKLDLIRKRAPKE